MIAGVEPMMLCKLSSCLDHYAASVIELVTIVTVYLHCARCVVHLAQDPQRPQPQSHG